MCIFCKIVEKEIPSFKIYENEYVYAFLDVNPCALGHTLIVPKKHFENIFDMEEEYAAEIFKAAIHISNLLKEKLNADGVNLINNSGAEAHQAVFHFHLHVLPRFKNDNLNFIQPTMKVDMDFLSQLQNKILK